MFGPKVNGATKIMNLKFFQRYPLHRGKKAFGNVTMAAPEA